MPSAGRRDTTPARATPAASVAFTGLAGGRGRRRNTGKKRVPRWVLPAAEGQKANLGRAEKSRRLASPAAEGSALRVGRDPSAPRCPLNRGWRRRRRAPLGRHPGSVRVFSAAALAGDGFPNLDGEQHRGTGGLLARCVCRWRRGEVAHGGELLCCGSGCRWSGYTPTDRVGSPSIPPRRVGGREGGGGSVHSPGHWLPGVSRPSLEHLLCACRAFRETGLLPLPFFVGQCPRQRCSRTPAQDLGQVRKMPRVWHAPGAELWEEGEACEAPPFGSCSLLIKATK